MGKSMDPVMATVALVCPSCGEVYDSRERAQEVLRNSGYCVNITCLEDLSHLPLGALLHRDTDGRRRADRRVG